MNVRHLHRKRMAWTVLLVLLLSVAGLTKAFAQPEGALNGVFTINANGDKVLFSQGNLQYIGSAATPYWKFADHQWDYLGNNGQNSSSQTADRDLFGWGTSGYHHNNTAYQPWTTSGSISYYAYGRSSYNLYDQTGQADWGYNAISNGGNQENSGWRTLTNDEWGYVFNTRTDAASKYGHGKVNGKKGMILLPDAWTTPEGLGFTSGNSNWTNVYSSEQWAQMEQNGAVFLPAAGYRDGTSVYVVGSYGYYWSSSCSSNSSHACYVYFSSGDLGPQYNNYRYHGQSVRLVQTIQQTTHTIEVSPNPVEGGTVMGGGTFEAGQPCTVTATANDGYTFANWTNNGTIVSTNSNYSFNVFGNMDLVANFMPEGNIDFADEAVKALCVANWDTDGDGELSYDEAAAVTSLGYVFYNNTEITSFEELQYFTGLTSIGNYAFYKCRNLTGSLIIPNSVTSIGNYAFYLCSNLTGSLVIPNTVTTINSGAFFQCWGFEGNLNIPNSVTSIGDVAFYGCDFSGPLIIPNSVISIGESAFGECYDFTGELTIPSSVTYIGSQAFLFCSGFTGNLTIPSSVTYLGYNPFIGCSGLEQIVVDSDNAYFDSRENCNAIIRTADNTLVAGCNNTVIPNSVTSIGICAFADCSGIISIEIPNGVTSIGDAAFVNCNNLTSLMVLAENPPTLVESVFEGVPLSISVYVPCGSEETYASQSWGGFNNFQGICGGTVTVAADLEEGGTVTGGGLFEAGQACTVTATANEGYVFVNWTSNGAIVSNNSTYTFHVANDMALVAHFVPEGNIDFADANVKALCVANWDTNGDGELSYAEAAAVTDFGYVFEYHTEITSFEELQYFVGLTTIGNFAFCSCSNLTGSLVIPNSVTTIGDYAFSECGFTGSLTIPSSVTSIGEGAFNYCYGFTGDLTISNSVTTIGDYAFYACSGLNGSLTIGSAVTTIGKYVFSYCRGLTGSLVIPDSVASIGNGAFYYCYGFTEIWCKSATPPAIGGYTFSYNAQPIYVPCGALSSYQDADYWSEFTNYSEALNVLVVSSSDEYLGSASILHNASCSDNECIVQAEAFPGGVFVNWTTPEGTEMSTETDYTFNLTEDIILIANFSQLPNYYNFVGGGTTWNWNDVDNWDTGELPNETSAVIVWSHTNVTEDVTVASVTIQDDKRVSVYDGASLTVTGTLNTTGSSTIWIYDGGQLYHANDGAEVMVEKTVAPYTEGEKDGWHLMASPIAGDLNPSIAGVTSGNYDLYYYDEPTYYWINQKQAENNFDILENTKGYLYGNSGDRMMTRNSPLSTYWGYSISECLYKASELTEAGLSGTLTSLSWYAHSTESEEQGNISIWMANVSDAQLTSTSHNTNDMTLVYTGSMIPVVGWNEYVFNQNGFTWDGTSNVLICIQRNNGTYDNGTYWRCNKDNLEFAAMAYNVNDYNPYDMESNTYSMTTTWNRPDVIFRTSNADTPIVNSLTSHSIYFSGIAKNGSETVNIPLSYTETAGNLKGFNLVGNPFAHNITSYGSVNVAEGCYRMNEAKDDLIVSEISDADPLKPTEGFFVKATASDASITFNPQRGATMTKTGSIRVEVLKDNMLVDRLLVKDAEGQPLEKFSLNEKRTKVFAVQGQKDLAIVPCESNEQPFSFKAAKDGQYSINVDADGMEFTYLHLIDNMTGSDVNLLVEPSYTFEAKTTDYASRFKLVFATGSSVDSESDSFAFLNSSGNLNIFGIEGEATLQVVDVLGHILSSETFSGSYEKKLNVAPGVYLLRLINGDNMKVQKIIIK